MNDVLRDFTIWLVGFFAAAVAYLGLAHLAAAKYRSMRARRRREAADDGHCAPR